MEIVSSVAEPTSMKCCASKCERELNVRPAPCTTSNSPPWNAGRSPLIACGNITGPAISIYRWQGKIASEKEWTAVLKTTEARFEALGKRLRELHSYDVPEIVAIPVSAASPDYAAWVAESCK